MISNQLAEPRIRGGIGVNASEQRFIHLGVRNIAPFYVPTTGAVRPQVGPAVIADMELDVDRGKAVLGVPAWSPPA